MYCRKRSLAYLTRSIRVMKGRDSGLSTAPTISIHVYIYTCVHVCMCTRLGAYLGRCTCVYIVHVCTCIYCTRVYVYILYTCVRVYVYTRTYVFTRISISYICVCRWWNTISASFLTRLQARCLKAYVCMCMHTCIWVYAYMIYVSSVWWKWEILCLERDSSPHLWHSRPVCYHFTT